jgi:hypothetical protein
VSGDPRQVTIRVQVLGGTWEVIGADRYRGVSAEGVQFTSNEAGYDTASFTLRRDPSAVHPDLLAWTPVEIWVAGALAWDGRVKETPAQEGADFSLNVQCEGWQYHLDDDLYSATYVHTALDGFGDERAVPVADLGTHPQYGQVQQDAGSILLSIPNGTAVTASHGVAVVCDLGTGGACKRAVVATTTSNNATNAVVYVIGTDTPDWTNTNAGRQDYVSAATLAAANGATLSATTASTHRYVTLLLWVTGTATYSADVWVKFTSVKLFSSTAYESGGVSALTADLIVKDALAQATVKLSADRSNIAAGAFSVANYGQAIPEFVVADMQTPRAVVSAANAYENYEFKMLPGRVPAFRPRAAAPLYEIGDWAGADLNDASVNSGDDIYNKVIVQASGPDGSQLSVVRLAADQGGPYSASGITASNPDFEVNTTGWSLVGGAGTLTRDTTVFDSGVASGRVDTESGVTAWTQLSGTFSPGNAYRLSMRVRETGAVGVVVRLATSATSITSTTDIVRVTSPTLAATTWTTVVLSFIPASTVVNPFFGSMALVP